MRTAVITFTAKGAGLAEKIAKTALPGAEIYCYERYAKGCEIPFFSVSVLMQEIFRHCDRILFIGAAAIAVRAIAPQLQSKLTDAAVLVVDENAQFVISLLSGHIGGGNDWCVQLAKKLGATAVITTATDQRNAFAADLFAKQNGLRIANPQMIKAISGKILNGEPVGIAAGNRYQRLLCDTEKKWNGQVCVTENADKTYDSGIQILLSEEEPLLFVHTLRLVPMDLAVGIGCKKGKSKEAVAQAVRQVFRQNGLLWERIGVVASVDRKAEEAGIINFAKDLHVPYQTYSAEQLKEVQGNFTASAWVASQVGVDNVCERSAFVASGGGRKIIGKTICDGVTAAVYQMIQPSI